MPAVVLEVQGEEGHGEAVVGGPGGGGGGGERGGQLEEGGILGGRRGEARVRRGKSMLGRKCIVWTLGWGGRGIRHVWV